MTTITFDSLPSAIMEINSKLDKLLVLQKQPIQDVDTLFTIEELCNYLTEKPARQTVYGWINNRCIPYEKYGRRLYFRKSNIDKWLSNGRQMKGL